MEAETHNDAMKLEQFRERLLTDLRVELMAMHLGDDYIISEEEAARLLEISTRTLYRMRKAGEIHAGVIAGKPKYSLGQIRRFMRETVRPK